MPTGGSSNVMTIVGSNPDVAVNNQLIHGRAQLAVFDIVRCMDLSVLEMPLVDRKVMLQQLHDLAKLPVQLVAHTTIGLTKDARADYMSRCLAAGFEGMVLKDPNAGYHSTTWRKEKICHYRRPKGSWLRTRQRKVCWPYRRTRARVAGRNSGL